MSTPGQHPSTRPDMPGEQNAHPSAGDGYTLLLDRVAKRYRGAPAGVWALRDVSLRIEPGIFGLLGRNGAGKTTLLQILSTLLDTSEGSVHMGPYDVKRDRWAVRHHLGYLPQEQGAYPTLTVAETLRYLAALQGLTQVERHVHRALEAVNLTDRASARVGSLSGGMRRRLGLAQALLGDPEVIIVDEPTAGLDPVEQQRFRTLLGRLGAQGTRTILLSTHIVDDVATIASRLAVLERGRLVFEGSVAALTVRAAGKVWDWPTTLDTVEAVRASGVLLVTSLTPLDMRDGSPAGRYVLARVVGPKPSEDATVRNASLEDGYFTIIGRTEGAREDGH